MVHNPLPASTSMVFRPQLNQALLFQWRFIIKARTLQPWNLFSIVLRNENDSPPQGIITKIKENQAYDYQPNVAYEDHTTLGTMSVVCDFCYALRWKGERAGMCCLQGKVNIPVLGSPPEPLSSLLLGEHPESKHFQDNIMRHNN